MTSNASAAPPSLMPLITGFMVSRLVYLAAELGIADHIAAGSVTASALAEKTATHAPSLHRMLRALCAYGVFEEPAPGTFSLNALGAQLRSGTPGTLRNFARFFGDQRIWRCLGEIEHSIRTGETGMQRAFGVSTFQWLSDHPAEAAIFNAAMADVTRQIARLAIAAYDFSPFRVILDVGGGNGTFLAEVLRAAPSATGMLFDLPAGLRQARETLAAVGVADRCELFEGDFFEAVPAGADLILLKRVVHDWDDDSASRILRRCRAVAARHTKLLLIERAMPARMTASPANQRAAALDIRMLTSAGGLERTEDQYRALLRNAGFSAERTFVLPAPSETSIIEAAAH
jgi:hypothetical protein